MDEISVNIKLIGALAATLTNEIVVVKIKPDILSLKVEIDKILGSEKVSYSIFKNGKIVNMETLFESTDTFHVFSNISGG